jgi:Dockerin type I domain
MHTRAIPIIALALAATAHAQVFVGEEYERRAQYAWTSDVLPGDGMDLIESFDPGDFSAELTDFAAGEPGYSMDLYAVQVSTIDDEKYWAAGKCGFTFSVGEGQGAQMDLSTSSSAFFLFELNVNAPNAPFHLTASLDRTDGWNLDLVVTDTDSGDILFETHDAGAVDETISLDHATFYSIEAAAHGTFQIDDPNLADVTFHEAANFEVDLEQLPACAADVNGDGNLDILDFVAFQQLWQQQDAAADCDGNGLFNILDFVCYQQLFQAGCP